MSGFLLDTNVFSEMIQPAPNTQVTGWLDSVDESLLYLSVLTLGEIRKGVTILTSGRRRLALESWLDSELQMRFTGRVLPIDSGVADRWGQLAGEAQTRGVALAVIDGLLVATALQHNLTLVSRNVRGFALPELTPFNPWEGTTA